MKGHETGMMGRIGNALRVALAAWAMLTAGMAVAQETWVQIEALPSLAEAEARAQAHAATFPNVSGFALPSGWYAIVLGPYAPDEAARQLVLLKGEGMIPADSYIPDATRFEERFWPVGDVQAIVPAAPVAPADPAPAGAVTPVVPDETPKQARLSESALTAEERQLLQRAMQWQGFYGGKLDGAFGASTRKSMAAWQSARGFDATGILTSAQRARLIADYNADLAAIGLATITDRQAGIEIALPEKLVQFGRYQPPFAQYDARDASGYQVLLISQKGDARTLSGLYDVMQTLDIVPPEGERERGTSAFVLTGKNDRIQSRTEVALTDDGLIKGFTLVWPSADSDRAARILAAMQASFRPVGDSAMDDSLGQPLDPSAGDLTAGLTVRKPIISRSGFFVGAQGEVLTTTEVIRGCGRVTIDGAYPADVAATDDAAGLVLLRPRTPLAPPKVAALGTAIPRPNSDIAVAGYAYEDTLGAPVMTFGTLADTRGLDGEAGVVRLAVGVLPGDAGGPVLDTSGSVVGMLLPRPTGGSRVLPADVAYARDAASLSALLAAQGVVPVSGSATGRLADEDLSALGRGMTVLVGCWE